MLVSQSRARKNHCGECGVAYMNADSGRDELRIARCYDEWCIDASAQVHPGGSRCRVRWKVRANPIVEDLKLDCRHIITRKCARVSRATYMSACISVRVSGLPAPRICAHAREIALSCPSGAL